MIRSTFCHIPTISQKREASLWNSGIHSWEDCDKLQHKGFPHSLAARIDRAIDESLSALERNDAGYFADSLPVNQHWRMFKEFRSTIAYVDIETTGAMGYYDDHITTIALYDGRSIFTYVHGENLRDFKDDIRRYNTIVTYNGKCFDIPIIERYFGIQLPHVHIDLRYVLRSLGYSGGLKGCEQQLGIARNDLQGVDGYYAVLLWNEFLRTSRHNALETLLAYNVEDVINLETLLVHSYNMKIAQTPLGREHTIELPLRPHVPFNVDKELLESLRRRLILS